MKQTDIQEFDEYVSGPFSVSMTPEVRGDLPIVERFLHGSTEVITWFAKNVKTDSGAAALNTRQFLVLRVKRIWPFTFCTLRMESGGLLAKSSCGVFSPFGRKKLKAVMKALWKAGIRVRMRDGGDIPRAFEFDKTVRNISRGVASRFKARDEFIVCQRLES